MGCFVEVSRRRDLKVNEGKSKVMLIYEEEESVCEDTADGTWLEHLSEFKYLGCVLVSCECYLLSDEY